jgi:hypothetical protein
MEYVRHSPRDITISVGFVAVRAALADGAVSFCDTFRSTLLDYAPR